MGNTNVFWTSDFQVKALVPKAEDNVNLASPQGIATTAFIELALDDVKTKGILLSVPNPGASCKLTIAFANDSTTPPVYGNGSFTWDFAKEGTLFLPLQNISKLKITNTEAGTETINYLLYLTP